MLEPPSKAGLSVALLRQGLSQQPLLTSLSKDKHLSKRPDLTAASGYR